MKRKGLSNRRVGTGDAAASFSWSAALVPGSGQWASGRTAVGVMAGTGTLVALTGSFFALAAIPDAGRIQEQDARRLLGYAAARGEVNTALAAILLQADANAARLQATRRLRTANIGVLLFYAWNLLDTYLFQQRKNNIRKLESKLYSHDVPVDGLRFAWRWSVQF